MIVGIPRETQDHERRVAATPETVRKLKEKGYSVLVEHLAGDGSHFDDFAYLNAGAELVTADKAFAADIIFKVNKPSAEEIKKMKPGASLVCLVDACTSLDICRLLADSKIDTFALERIPRVSRAQSMDVLSSQANIAGYRAALNAAYLYSSFFPMMMTSAGVAKPAKALILGAGVAGLQAIATVKKLGARVYAYDVRPEVKEQTESLGATFIEIPMENSGSGDGGYARKLTEEEQTQQQEKLGEIMKGMNIIISTALIPCRRAPVLITEDVVQGMQKGSVIIDLAASGGGNCALTEANATVIQHGVTIYGETNLASQMATDASAFYSTNLVNFLSLMIDEKDGKLSRKDYFADEITSASLVTHNGEIRAL